MSTYSEIREKRGLSKTTVSRISGITEDRLSQIEVTGKATKREEKRLAGTFGVPEYALGLEAENIQALPHDFRTVGNRKPTYGLRGLSAIYEMQTLVDFAEMIAERTQLESQFNAFRKQKALDLNDSKPQGVVAALREITGYRFDDSLGEIGAAELFNSLRSSIEALNIFVVCEKLNEERYRGFCLSGDKFPIIYINTFKQPYVIRNFTLIHELVHLLLGRPGVVDPFNTRSQIEKTCNTITAQFFLPEKAFRDYASRSKRPFPLLWVDALARSLPFSKFFLALRIQEVFEIKGFANDWLASLPRKVSVEFDDVSYDRYDISDEGLLEIGDYEKAAHDNDGEESAAFARQTAASYQANRLGSAVLNLLGAGLKAGLISKYDVYDRLRVRTSVMDDALVSALRKKSRAKKFQ